MVSLLTVGHAPRDDIAPELRELIRSEIEITQAGALDTFTPDEALTQFAPIYGEPTMVSRLRDGRMGTFSAAKAMPLLQACIDCACDDGADIVVVLCTNRFYGLRCRVPLILPFDLLHGTVKALNAGLHIGALFPLETYAHEMAEWWMEYGVNPDYLCVAPNAQLDLDVIGLQFSSVDFLILDCIGYNRRIRDQLSQSLGIPIIWPRALIADMVNSLLM